MFSGMFSNVFRNVFLCLLSFNVYDASFSFVSTGCSDFFISRKKRNLKKFGYFKLKCQGVRERVGFKIFLS
jgi:hypothetical protein